MNASSNIQWAVNVGTNGDTVWISNGTYYLTNQVTVNSNITICGNRGELVVVDGNSAKRCFYFTNTANTAGVLSNLFITGGNTNGNGGGVYMYSGTVLDCVFSNNISGGLNSGGGMYLYTGSGIIQRCSFINNNAYDGGGLYLSTVSNTWIDACLFRTNTALNTAGGFYALNCNNTVITGCDFICNVAATNSGGGKCYFSGVNNFITHCTISSNIAIAAECGGFYVRGGWTLTNLFVSNNIAFAGGGGLYLRDINAVRNCVIARNRTTSEAIVNQGGGGIWNNTGSFVVQDCIIEENKSGFWGGGIYIGGQSIINCLIRNNVVSGINGGRGGGVRISGSDASDRLINCTIVSNYAGGFAGGLYNPYGIKVENCIIYNNASSVEGQSNYYNGSGATTVSFSNCCFAPALAADYANYSTNNITANPQFVNWEGGNYRLARGSPCINTGVNRDWMTNAVDLDGRLRIRYGIVDMGAYERINEGTIYKFR